MYTTWAESRATSVARGRRADGRLRRPEALWARVILLLVVVSVVPWRDQAIYSGGVDVVVVAKAIIAITAAGVAAVAALRTHERQRVAMAPAIIVTMIVATSVIGSYAAGDAVSASVQAARILLCVVAVSLAARLLGPEDLIYALLSVLAVIALVSALTGIPTLATGRLGGGIPAVHPNELAGLAAPPLIGAVALSVRRGITPARTLVVLALGGILVATGSRTALIATALAAGVALVTNGRLKPDMVMVLLACLPVAYAAAFFTPVVDELASRGGTTDTSATLMARYDGWRVVLGWEWASWEKWLGKGLSTKTVAVDLRWRDTQVLDSSWISALAQVGVAGTLLLVVLLLVALVRAVRSSKLRGVALPLLVLIVARGFTESGLLDSAVMFVVFFTLATALAADRYDDRDLPLGKRTHAVNGEYS